MLPASAITEASDRLYMEAVLGRDVGCGARVGEDRVCLGLGQLRPTVSLAASRVSARMPVGCLHALAVNRVARVVCGGAKIQMVGVEARRVIAAMEDEGVAWVSSPESPGPAVDEHLDPTGPVDATVALGIATAVPFPAASLGIDRAALD
jgi:hypothetical protein